MGSNKNYLTSTQTAHNGTLCNFFVAYGITIDLNGSTVTADPALSNSGSAIFCFQQAGMFDYETVATHYAAGTITKGDSTITLTTHAQAANFTPGHQIFIQGDTATLNNAGLNFVTAANSSSGVLTLAWPVNKTYSTTPIAADVEQYTGVNYALINGTIHTNQIQATIATQIRGMRLDNLVIWTSTSNATEPNQWNYIMNGTVTNSAITSNSGPLIDYGGRTCTRCRAVNDTLSLIPNGTTGPTLTAVNAGEGAEGTVFSALSITVAGGSATGMDISNSFSTTIDNVSIVMGSSATSAAYVTNNGAPGTTGAVSPSFTGGSIQTSASYGAILGAADVDTFTGVPILLTGATAQCIHAIGRANIVGGSCIGMVPGASGIIIEGAAAMGTRVSGVSIKASNSANHAFAIYVADPGAQQTVDPVIIGNQIEGYDTVPIGVQNISHNANLIVCANGAVANAGIGCGH